MEVRPSVSKEPYTTALTANLPYSDIHVPLTTDHYIDIYNRTLSDDVKSKGISNVGSPLELHNLRVVHVSSKESEQEQKSYHAAKVTRTNHARMVASMLPLQHSRH